MHLKKAAVEFVRQSHTRGKTPSLRLVLFETDPEISEQQNAPCWRVRDIIEYDPARIDLLIETLRGEELDLTHYPGAGFEEIIVAPHSNQAPRIEIPKLSGYSQMHYAAPIIDAMHAQWLRDLVTSEVI